jgi:DNA-binding MarR family transcriptional regulator
MATDSRSKKEEARRCSEAMRDLLVGFRARLEEDLRGTGITLAQLRMLKAIEGQSEVSGASIARQCQITPQTLHSMLTRATREGWIVRGSSDRNHRIVTAALTPKGEAILQQAMGLKERIEAEIWHGVPLASMHVMRETIERGVANLNRS